MDQGYEKDGYFGAMNAAAETLVLISRETYVSPFFIAMVYSFAEDKEKTLEWLENGFEMKDPNMPYIRTFRLLHDDPRYQELLRKMNLPLVR
jgi:hypothetical protein